MIEALNDNGIVKIFKFLAKSIDADDYKIIPFQDGCAELKFCKSTGDGILKFKSTVYAVKPVMRICVVEAKDIHEDDMPHILRKILEKMLKLSENGWTIKVVGQCNEKSYSKVSCCILIQLWRLC